MAEYLSKEEIKQWRGSLEKITLEEFAARLGKEIEPAKPTNDLVDIVLQGKPVVSNEPEYKRKHAERLSSIAERAYEREQQIAPTPFSIRRFQNEQTKSAVTKEKTIKPKTENKVSIQKQTKSAQKPKTAEKITKLTKPVKSSKPSKSVKSTKAVNPKTTDLREEVRIVFKKALTDREQKVFDHFSQNRGKIVYAKDLAELLELPKDYVYKYIKNLRTKIEGSRLENADKGGFILNI